MEGQENNKMVRMEMKYMYGNVVCDTLKSNNWKKMHGIPLKTKARTENGCNIFKIFKISEKYVSKRSKKKRAKAHFRCCFNPIIESQLENNPKAKQIYHRYGYMKKKCRKVILAEVRNKNENSIFKYNISSHN